ncbi:MAG: insulinase family protein, partial [Treponema sp.]|nr:insulinase family protein [Treponema sp.]
ETYIASIPQKESWNNWNKIDFKRPTAGAVKKSENSVYKGKENKSLVYMSWFVDTPFSEEASITAQVLEEYLDIVMTQEIREKLGGVYSVSVGVTVSPVPAGELSMYVYFACDPRRVDELTSAVINLLNTAAGMPGTAGITNDTFVKAVAALKKQWETSVQSNSYIAQSYANSSVLLNLPLSRLTRRPQYYDAVTSGAIQAMCSQALANGPAQIVLYPEQ